MLLGKQDDDWAVGRAYSSAEAIAQIDGPPPAEEVVPLLMASETITVD